MIKLTITQPTFEKYLYSYGYNYKIKQFNDFISAIQRMVFKRINDTENLSDTLSEIFLHYPNISVLLDKENIVSIKKDFLISLIEDSQLDLYFIDKVEKFSNKEMKEAYKLKLMTTQINNSNNLNASYTLSNIRIQDLKAKKCFDMSMINLSQEDKKSSGIEFYHELFDYTRVSYNDEDIYYHFLLFLGLTMKLTDSHDFYMDYLHKSKFIFEENNKIEIYFSKKVNKLINSLSELYEYSSVLKAIAYRSTRIDEDISASDLLNFIYIKKGIFSRDTPDLVCEKALELTKIITLSREEILETSFTIRNSTNTNTMVFKNLF